MVAERKKPRKVEKSKPSAFSEPAATGLAAQNVAERLAGLDARAQSALLQDVFNTPEPFRPDAPVSDPSHERRGVARRIAWRALKSAVGLAIVVVAGVGPVQRLFQFSSVEAVVNARLVTLRAPIDGKIADANILPTIGTMAPKGRVMFHISNSRADRARLDELQRMLDQAESDRPAVAARLDRLKEIFEQISHQARAFQAGRVRELEERVMDLKAQASATEASEQEAASTLARTRVLAESGYQTPVAVERAERDAKVAAQNGRSLSHRLFASLVELEAARRGEYVGDSYNDRPSSLQHADELSVRIAETEAELTARDQRIGSLHAALNTEASQYSELSSAELSSPTDAQVWEVLISPGEEVRRGQDLLRLLDCSGAIVTATVRETVFDRLRLGDKAQFRLSGQSTRYEGSVVRMSGMAAPLDNLAIQSNALSSPGYRIAISVPGIASKQCAVGRTGTVVFDTSSGSEGPLQSLRGAVAYFLPGF